MLDIEIVIVRAADREWFLAWSPVVSAPITRGLTEAALSEFLTSHNSHPGEEELNRRIEAARTRDENGRWAANAAGVGGEIATEEEIIRLYCGPDKKGYSNAR